MKSLLLFPMSKWVDYHLKINTILLLQPCHWWTHPWCGITKEIRKGGCLSIDELCINGFFFFSLFFSFFFGVRLLVWKWGWSRTLMASVAIEDVILRLLLKKLNEYQYDMIRIMDGLCLHLLSFSQTKVCDHSLSYSDLLYDNWEK